MKKSVYIETTIVSYLAARPSRDVIRTARQTITRQWWDDRLQDFDLFVSELVFNEAKKGDKRAAERRMQIIEGLTRLDIPGEAIELAAVIVEKGLKGLMPPKAADDALHLPGSVTVFGADVWKSPVFPVRTTFQWQQC